MICNNDLNKEKSYRKCNELYQDFDSLTTPIGNNCYWTPYYIFNGIFNLIDVVSNGNITNFTGSRAMVNQPSAALLSFTT